MLLGVINKKNEQIYIKSKIRNNCTYIYFDKVDKNGIVHLSYNEAFDIFCELFNTEKRYLYNDSLYDIYIDSNNLKRFYKDGREDFKMFYLANGVDATMYKNKKTKPLSKLYAFLLGGLTATAIISCYGADFLDSYINNNTENVQYVVDVESDKYEPVTVYKLQDYLFSSDGLSSDEKVNIYNEEYFNYLVNCVDESRKLYDYNIRFDGINVNRYDESVFPGTNGFYDSSKPNTINVLDTIIIDENLKDTESHEFVHLTQCGRFTFIKEALAEIISNEFYDAPCLSYPDAVKRVKVLMEIIGSKAVFNAAYSYNTDYFENSIKDLLSSKDSKELIGLFCNYDYFGETNEATCERIDELLRKMLEHKKERCSYEEGVCDELIISSIMNDSLPTTRVYFNSYKPCFYEPSNITTFIPDCEIPTNVETCKSVLISTIVYSISDFMHNLNDSKFKDFIDNYGSIILIKGENKLCFYKDSTGQFRCDDDDPRDNIYYSFDEIINDYSYDYITFTFSETNYNYDDIKNNEFLNNFDNCYLTGKFEDNKKFTVYCENSIKKYNIVRATVPSIYEKFGCINIDVDKHEEYSMTEEVNHTK